MTDAETDAQVVRDFIDNYASGRFTQSEAAAALDRILAELQQVKAVIRKANALLDEGRINDVDALLGAALEGTDQ